MNELFLSIVGFLSGGIGGALVNYALARRAEIASQVREQKRALYASLARSLRVFQGGGGSTEAAGSAFLEDYAQVWLWASDDVVEALNAFIDLNRRLAAGDASVQAELDRSFDALMLSMRRDLRSTRLAPGTYRSIAFR